MEPRIQYARTADGVSIAFRTVGEGTPLVVMPNTPFTHMQLEWQIPEQRRFAERLAQKRRLIGYDSRGTGLSERKIADFSLDTLLLDLEAVVHRLDLERFALLAYVQSGPVALAFAAHHPEHVSHLILWGSYATASDYYQSAEIQALRGIREKSWELYTEALAHTALGWSEGEEARRYAAYMRECITPEAAQTIFTVLAGLDSSDLLPQVRSPTLVLHRREAAFPHVDLPKELAARIPEARLVLLEGASLAAYLGDMEAVAQAIDEFLGEGEEAAVAAAAPSGLVTILFTDMESSTALTQRLGDAKAQDVLRTHNSIVRDSLKAHGGSEIKHTGDGIMASFPSASRALECAVGIQRAVAAHVEQHSETPLRVRIGLNAGEPVVEDEDLFGTAVQLAARICAHAEPGQILAPTVVRELAAGKGFLLADLGQVVLRGFEDPVRLYEVSWREQT